MPRLSERLRQEFEGVLNSRIISLAACRQGEANAEELKTVDELIQEGHDPVHALYINVNNLISLFAEQVMEFPMFQKAYRFLEKAQDQYCPGYPPMSPITVSYYTCWTLYDVPFGKAKETIGDCFVGLTDLLGLHPLQIEAARNLCQSRMGIYEVLGAAASCFRLRELVTDRELQAVIPSGFKGKPGDLILIRLLPPVPDCGLPHVGMTTPYVLVGCLGVDWIHYFGRHQIVPGAVGCEERLRRHMKEGRDTYYWSEFAFYGYLNFRSDAIFLAGFPDQPYTQPAHNTFDLRTLDVRRAKSQIA